MEKILPWFSLKSVPGIGNHFFKKLIDTFESPEAVFEASYEDLCLVEGVSKKLVYAIQKHITPDTVKKEIDIAFAKNIKIITMGDAKYPPLLHQIPDPPPYLYVLGDLESNTDNISVVGSRNATDYGITTTIHLCKDLAALKLNIVSGMARGIDTAAHRGALMVNGRTTAVLGSGLGRIYPPENIKLSQRIAQKGAVISEFPMMAEPEPHNFPIRNRLISGISLGTVVVEATRRSGSLITARLAAEQNREVFAVPGSVTSFKSTGTHSLLKQGAKLVEHAQDIVEELSFAIGLNNKDVDTGNKTAKTKMPELNQDELPVFEALEPYPVHIDDITRKITMEPGKLAAILLKLELQGLVKQSPGKLFFINEEH